MKRSWMVGMGTALLVGVTGCGKIGGGGAQSGTVAVIDLDVIASQLGSQQAIAESITKQQESLNNQLVELARSYSAQISEQQRVLADNPNQESEVQLAGWQRQAEVQLNQAKRQAQSDVVRYRAQLVNDFREQVRPVARQVADARGLSIIVTKNDSVVFDYGSAVDITNEVLEQLGGVVAAPNSSP
ncbi:MAG: OmpH family outer membrane protein [Planctomycetales bacterium]|nr:OmpH family outer membrane protein [Planctomycetales bacterium]